MYSKNITIAGTNLGYLYFIDYNHPLATGNSGRVLLHRHIASISAGRWLRSEEHVHHIDGNKQNNTAENLQILTLQEHNKLHNPPKFLVCEHCKKEYPKLTHEKTKFCSTTCYNLSRVRNIEITKEILDELIPTTSWTNLGKLFGYSDVGIKKRAKALGCTMPPKYSIRG